MPRTNWRLIFVLLTETALAQPRFPMRYLGEVGHLGTPGNPRSASLGFASVHADNGGGHLRVQGLDAGGKAWRVRMPIDGSGGGFTEVFTADFDANGRPDLLFADHFTGVGKCIDTLRLTVLLFDEAGRPVDEIDPCIEEPAVTLVCCDLGDDVV